MRVRLGRVILPQRFRQRHLLGGLPPRHAAGAAQALLEHLTCRPMARHDRDAQRREPERRWRRARQRGGAGAPRAYATSDGRHGARRLQPAYRHELGHNFGINHLTSESPEGHTILSGNKLARFSGAERYVFETYRNAVGFRAQPAYTVPRRRSRRATKDVRRPPSPASGT